MGVLALETIRPSIGSFLNHLEATLWKIGFSRLGGGYGEQLLVVVVHQRIGKVIGITFDVGQSLVGG